MLPEMTVAAGLLAPVKPIEYILPQGNLNHNSMMRDSKGTVVIVRKINEQGREIETPRIADEYKGVGFLENPQNQFFYRSYPEQATVMKELASAGVPVVLPRFSSEEQQIIDYIPHSLNLTQSWIQNHKDAPRYTRLVLDELQKAHAKNYAIGDRRGGNELIVRGKNVRFIDFDIGIRGPDAKEFDLAGLLYFISHKVHVGSPTREGKLLAALQSFLGDPQLSATYNMPLLKDYVQRYFSYFRSGGAYRWKTPEANKAYEAALLSGT